MTATLRSSSRSVTSSTGSIRGTRLHPLPPELARWAQGLEMAAAADGYHTTIGTTAEDHARSFWDGTTHYVATAGREPRPAVLLSVYDHSARNRTASLSVVAEPGVRRAGVVPAAMLLALHELSVTWNLRLVHLEANSRSERSLRSLVGPLLAEEARLVGYYRAADGSRREDKVVFTVDCARWRSELAASIAAALAGELGLRQLLDRIRDGDRPSEY